LDIRQFRGDKLNITNYELPDSELYRSEVTNWTLISDKRKDVISVFIGSEVTNWT